MIDVLYFIVFLLPHCVPERRDLPAVACRARHRLWFGGWKGASAVNSTLSLWVYEAQNSDYWKFEYFFFVRHGCFLITGFWYFYVILLC